MSPCELAPRAVQPRAQVPSNGGGGSCYHCHYYICKQSRNKIGKKTKKNKIYKKTHKKERHQRGPCDNNKALFAYCEFFFLFSTLGTQALFGVQLFIKFYMKNRYKNLKIIEQASLDQDRQMNDICNLSKTPTKPTFNIKPN
jgi:hypothetical protein